MADQAKALQKRNDGCIVCGQGAAYSLKRCSRCIAVFYCSAACQTKDWPSHKKDCARLKIEAAQQAEVEAGVKAKQSLAERNNVPRITSDGAVFMDKKTGDVVCSLEQFRAKMLLKVMMMKEGDVEDPLNTPGFGPATGVPHKEEMRLIRAKFKKQQAKDPAPPGKTEPSDAEVIELYNKINPPATYVGAPQTSPGAHEALAIMKRQREDWHISFQRLLLLIAEGKITM